MAVERPPRIVHLLDSLRCGGTEKALVRLLSRFDDGAFRHTVVTLRHAEPQAGDLPDHVGCYAMNLAGRRWGAWYGLARRVRRWDAAVLHARNIGTWVDATATSLLVPGLRLVLGYHGRDEDAPLGRAQQRKTRWGLWSKARFVSVSQKGAEELSAAGVPNDRLAVLGNGVDVGAFRRVGLEQRRLVRQSWGVGADSVVFGTVGSLTPVKAHGLLLQALAMLSQSVTNVRLVVVGDGPCRAALMEEARLLGAASRTTWTGWRPDVEAQLSGMDVYVCCSRYEGMSNALLEAMAAGKASIATDVGDNGRLIRHERDGFIIKPGSAAALAEAVQRLAQNSSLRQDLASSAFRRAEAFDLDSAARRYEDYYRTLLSSKRQR